MEEDNSAKILLLFFMFHHHHHQIKSNLLQLQKFKTNVYYLVEK